MFLFLLSLPTTHAGGFSVDVAELTVDGVTARDLSCDFEPGSGGLLAGAAVVAALSTAKPAMDACTPDGGAARIAWSSDASTVNVVAASTPAAGACIAKAASRVVGSTGGSCEVTVLVGADEGARAAANALQPAAAQGEPVRDLSRVARPDFPGLLAKGEDGSPNGLLVSDTHCEASDDDFLDTLFDEVDADVKTLGGCKDALHACSTEKIAVQIAWVPGRAGTLSAPSSDVAECVTRGLATVSAGLRRSCRATVFVGPSAPEAPTATSAR